MARPHDNLFREVFSDPEEIAALLRSILPPELVGEIQWAGLCRVPGDFVDAELRDVHADLLFLVVVGNEEVLLYILTEHKSWPDHDTAFQVHRNITRIWERWRKDHPGKPLPPVLPYVLYHGERPWSGPRRLQDLVDFAGISARGARFLRGLMPDCGFFLDDLTAQSEADLARRSLQAMGCLASLMMQQARDCTAEELAAALTRWNDLIARVLDAHGQERVVVILSYLLQATDVEPERVRAAVRGTLAPRVEEALMSTAERLQNQGFIRGHAAGRVEGRVETLLQLLKHRFGPLSSEVETRIRAGTEAELERWTDAVLTAPTLQQLLAT